MFTKKMLRSTLCLVVITLLLSACGGEGGDNTPPARHTGTISGNVFDAPVTGSTVYVWEFEDGKIGRQLATTTTDAFGDYNVEIESSSRSLLVSAQGGSYIDPLTHETVSVSDGKMLRLDGVLNYRDGSDQRQMLTPLTNIVAGLTKYNIKRGISGPNAVSESLDSINAMYGFNVNETKPIDITKGGQSSFVTPGHKYGALLTAYSSYAHDLINKYGNSDNIYTSLHLADIQYRDVLADGYLNGEEISGLTGALSPLTFGQKKITSDVYTNELAQHVLIVVNDLNLNISGTDASEYVDFGNKINELGSHSRSDGVIPPRDKIGIDTQAPNVKRTDSDILAGTDKVDITLTDDIGVRSVSAYIEYQVNGVWSEEYRCDDLMSSGSEFCSIEFNDFNEGLRDTKIKVSINTNAIDNVDSNSGISNITAARLVFYPIDVLGNDLTLNSGTGHYVNFEWDNDAPVIDVTSVTAINNQLQEYILKGIVKEESQDIKSVSVSFKGGLPEELTCSPVTVESGSACEFSKAYSTGEFISTTTFEIKATDSNGNVGSAERSVSRDDQSPTQVVTYPDGATMTFVNVSVDGKRSTYDGLYTEGTYTADNVQATRDYLKINYIYASSGIQNSIKGIDFKNFNPHLLKQNKIPYVRVKVSDINNDTVLGSSAEKLRLVVEYYVSQKNDGNYVLQNTIETIASDNDFTAKIPHETLMHSDGRVDEVIYYVPFVRETLGEDFKSASENSSQKLVIKTIDASDNQSAVQEVYFRRSFDLPTMTVITPFIGARVQLEGLNLNGEFTSLASCTSIQQIEDGSNILALDVATCETTTDVVNYDFMRLRLLGVDGSNPYYYQWKTDTGAKENVNLNNANIGAYFKLNGSQTFYVTELSAYQTGLFDYKWNQVEAGKKTAERAIKILDDVQRALAGQNNNSFFGFDPTVVSYATNRMLAMKPIPENPSNDYLHRFLVEAIGDMAQDMPRNNSLDFAAAVYDDFSYDGKANGIGAGGSQITLDFYKFSSDTYRNDLAQSYYDLMTNRYGIASNIAQLYADDISMANPYLDGGPIFDTSGKSIDVLPPQPKLTIESGRSTKVGNKYYIAGEVVSKILLEDPSGIVESGEHQPLFSTMWFKKSEPNTSIPINVGITSDPANSNSYKKEYIYSINTESSDLKDIIEFAIEASAMDSHGNTYGYDGKAPYTESLYVDNDYPQALYFPPKDVNGDPLPEENYLNANNVHELTFKLKDAVGDALDKRGLVFYQQTGKKVSYKPADFSLNSTESFKVKLCTGDRCSNQGKTIYPGDGDWLVVVQAEDNLENSVSELTSTAPRFNIHIDSEGPLVKGEEIQNRLGGNALWAPVIDWGTLSQGSDVKIELRRGSGQAVELKSCDPSLESCEDPYLVGTQPDVKVQLTANAFDYNLLNGFYVTATDNAYPVNVSTTGLFTFKVDNIGPEIVLDTPWVKDVLSGESYVLGRQFNVQFASVTDDSKIAEVSLFQEGKSDPIKSILPTNPSSKFVMDLTKTDTDKIVVSDDEKTTSLYVQTVDIHGFESKSNTKSIILDRDGPTLGLNGFNENDYYLGNYVFTLTAQDLNTNGDQSIDGVNKESLEFWTFAGTEPLPGTTPGSKPDENLKIHLGNLSDGINFVRLKGSDMRGNTTLTSGEEDFRIKVKNSEPEVSLTMGYDDGTSVKNNTINRDGNIILTLDVVDESGVDKIDATYKYSGQENGTSFTFVESSNGKWKATLLPTQISQDGRYELDIKVYNNVRYIDDKDRNIGIVNQTFSVQRQGVNLSITKPMDFQNYISDGTLAVTFNAVGEVKAQTLECWVREAYTSDDVPSDDSAYSGVLNVSQEPYSCTVTSGSNMSKAPVALITRTKGTNGKITVSKYNFKMMDTGVPTVVNEKSYDFTGDDVWFNDAQQKMLTFAITFQDDLSGVDISNQDTYPKLVRNQGNKSFTPQSCFTSIGNITSCTYSELYSDIINGLSIEQKYKIKNLVDVANNVAPDHNFLLQLPQGNVDVDIISPEESATINGKQLVVDFRIKLYENSRLDNVVVNYGDKSYSYKENSNKFDPVVGCSGPDGGMYQCSRFTSELPEGSDGQSLTISVAANDVWAKTGEDKVSIRVDNTAPKIGEDVTMTQSETSPEKVRFRFDVTDSGSGLEKVKYSVFNPKHEEEKMEDGSGSSTYFELDKLDIEGLSTITVDIIATDNVGLTSNVRKIIDVKTPEITLNFDAGVELSGGKLLFKQDSQPFTFAVIEGGEIKALHYSLDFTSSEVDDFIHSGDFALSSANDTMNFAPDKQAVYQFKVKVKDSIGREINNFTLLGKKYDAKGIEAVVDYELPIIASINGDQISMVPENGRYRLDVKALVSDKNLSVVTSSAADGEGVKFTPTSITEPSKESDLYVMHYLVPPGNYSVKVMASDLAGHRSEKSINAVVDEATIPKLTISTENKTSIAGAEEVTLVFTFSEEVTNFDLADVKLLASDGGDTGQLQSETWTTKENMIWTVKYISPVKQNKNITIQVNDSSYQSINTIPGKGDSLVIGVEGILPTLTKVTFNPTQQVIGQMVNVQLTFDKELQAVTAKLGTTLISSLSPNSDKTVWSGDVLVSSTVDRKVDLVVSEYKDLIGNVGEINSEHFLPITPTLTLDHRGDVNGSGASAVVIAGGSTRFESGATVMVKAIDANGKAASATATVGADGAWTTSLDIAGLTDGTITVSVTGTNDLRATAEPAQTTFMFEQSKPTVDDSKTRMSPDFAAAGDTVTVSVAFDKAVTAPTGSTLGSAVVTWTPQASASQTWSGSVQIAPAADDTRRVALTLQGFSDAAGNQGEAFTSATALAMTPTLTLDHRGDVNGSGASAVVIAGGSTRFESGATVMVKAIDANGKAASATATVGADGAWTTSLDIAGLTDGTITVFVNGSNDLSASAQEEQTSFNLDKMVTAFLFNSSRYTSYSEGNVGYQQAA
ncbi:tandem large repeat [Photobacterium nomapromontoriensis]|uniref:tandem large repeat n=1 Tax=Photobacterium nomapromontoriensis TaxID=2910237 RepID=UPI003D0B8B3F